MWSNHNFHMQPCQNYHAGKIKRPVNASTAQFLLEKNKVLSDENIDGSDNNLLNNVIIYYINRYNFLRKPYDYFEYKIDFSRKTLNRNLLAAMSHNYWGHLTSQKIKYFLTISLKENLHKLKYYIRTRHVQHASVLFMCFKLTNTL